MKSIFDSSDVSDIPESIVCGLRNSDYTNEILALFRLSIDKELTVDEVTVAYYRKYTAGTNKKPKTKQAIMAKLYQMGLNKNCSIYPVKGKKGTYRLGGTK